MCGHEFGWRRLLMELAPGHRIGNLEIERELGRGFFGVVYLAKDTLIRRRVALKVILRRGAKIDPDERAQILEEARIVAGLSSPHIVTLYGLHETEDGSFMQEMEFVAGGVLEDRIEGESRLDPEEAMRVFRALCDGLACAHEARIIHADIKPANVLFDTDGTLKIADFGVARILEGTEVSIPLYGRSLGSPFYMAPEVISGESASAASDVWSAGVTLYQLLTGRPPFPGKSLPELLLKVTMDDPDPLEVDLPDWITEMLDQCLLKEYEQRPSARELVEMIDAARPGGAARKVFTNRDAPDTSFVGRESELDTLKILLAAENVRMITMTGPLGIGKTRLGWEVSSRVLDEFPGGCVFVDLTSAADVAAMEEAICDSLGEEPGNRAGLLLVLDGVEGRQSTLAEGLGQWLPRWPGTRFLLLSSSILFLTGEHRFELGPMSQPDRLTESSAVLDDFSLHDSMRLFAVRAEDAGVDLDLEGSDLMDSARIIAPLAGFPLAIEEAAAQLKPEGPARLSKTPEEILEGSFVQVREQYDQLEDWEQDALMQAACFEGGFSLDAAEAVIDIEAHPDAPLVMDAVQGLWDKSFLTAEERELDTRFDLYRLIREFARREWRQTMDLSAQASLQRRHAEFYLALSGLDSDVERANMSVAKEWAEANQ